MFSGTCSVFKAEIVCFIGLVAGDESCSDVVEDLVGNVMEAFSSALSSGSGADVVWVGAAVDGAFRRGPRARPLVICVSCGPFSLASGLVVEVLILIVR